MLMMLKLHVVNLDSNTPLEHYQEKRFQMEVDKYGYPKSTVMDENKICPVVHMINWGIIVVTMEKQEYNVRLQVNKSACGILLQLTINSNCNCPHPYITNCSHHYIS
jgi:hypothetical protein